MSAGASLSESGCSCTQDQHGSGGHEQDRGGSEVPVLDAELRGDRADEIRGHPGCCGNGDRPPEQATTPAASAISAAARSQTWFSAKPTFVMTFMVLGTFTSFDRPYAITRITDL